MSGTGALASPRWPAARNPYDICVCGDYRRDHEGGTGPCTFSADQVAGHEPCRGFRLGVRSRAGEQTCC
jgi:hypothetical protein